MSEPIFTFTPQFREFLPLYQDVTRVWIGDGTNGSLGELYAEYADGTQSDIGSVSLYPLALEEGYQGTAQEWMHDIVDLVEAGKDATATTVYYNSTSGSIDPTLVPATDWSSAPNPQPGKYIWSKITLTWNNGSSSAIYTVTYVGTNGAVNSVNGKTGNVTVYGDDIPVESESEQTIKSYIDGLNGSNLLIENESEQSIKDYVDSEIEEVSETVSGLNGDTLVIESNSEETIKHYIDNLVFTPVTATEEDIAALFGIEQEE